MTNDMLTAELMFVERYYDLLAAAWLSGENSILYWYNTV